MLHGLANNTWHPGRAHILSGGVWQPAQRLWLLQQKPGPIDPPEFEWRMVADYAVPTTIVPGVNIVRGFQISPPTAQVVWTSVTSPEDYRYHFGVQVEWYRNGEFYDTDSAAQTAGQVPFREFAEGDSVYARVKYTSMYGDGPYTETAVLNL